MDTIVGNLSLLQDTKTNIKAAIEAKGLEVGEALFEEYPDKISQISSGSGDIVLKFKNATIKALADNPSYQSCQLYAFKATDDSLKMTRPNNGMYPRGTKVIYSDGAEYIDYHVHTFDTSKDIDIMEDVKLRYQIILFTNIYLMFYETPQIVAPYDPSSWRVVSGILYVIGNRMTFSSSRSLDCGTIRYFGMIDQYLPESTDMHDVWFRGTYPEIIDGLNFKNIKFSYAGVETWKNISNINTNVDFRNNAYSFLTRESSLVIFNALVLVTDGSTKTVSINYSTNLRLTNEDRKIVTDKGWILTS